MKRILSILFLLSSFLLTFAPTGSTQAATLPNKSYAHLAAPLAATTVTVTRAPGTVGRGYTASVTVKTKANTTCSISVYYKSGRSTAAGLVTRKSNASGVVSWSWKVGTRTTPGRWPVYITCGGTQATTYVTVR